MSARVVGIGGIFFKARDPEQLRAWYRDHLGLAVGDWGGVLFDGATASPGGRQAGTVWSVFPEHTEYFRPSTAAFMINYRVEDLDHVLVRRCAPKAAPWTSGWRGGRTGRNVEHSPRSVA